MIKLFNISGGPGSQQGTTGNQTVPATSVLTLIASIYTSGMGMLAINGFVASGSLTDFVLAFATAAPVTSGNAPLSGTSVNRLISSAGDFGTATNLLNNSTASPHSTAANGGFYCDLDLNGRYHRVDIYAKSAAGAVVSFDATGSGTNVG